MNLIIFTVHIILTYAVMILHFDVILRLYEHQIFAIKMNTTSFFFGDIIVAVRIKRRELLVRCDYYV